MTAPNCPHPLNQRVVIGEGNNMRMQSAHGLLCNACGATARLVWDTEELDAHDPPFWNGTPRATEPCFCGNVTNPPARCPTHGDRSIR